MTYQEPTGQNFSSPQRPEGSAPQTIVSAPSIDPSEVERFQAMADSWWDPEGKFKPLHKFNPVRIGFVRDCLCQHFGRDPKTMRPLEGLRLLDIGCGGGLISEPMARLGAQVTAIDAAEGNIKTAMLHAEQHGLTIAYRHSSAEALLESGATPFDAILNLEVIEHVTDPSAFVACSARLLRPGGLTVIATLNRTLKSLALAKIGAEYILRWLPAGTHDWRKFLRPSEIGGFLRHAGLVQTRTQGVSYNPLKDQWSLSRDLDVNYMIVAEKPQT